MNFIKTIMLCGIFALGLASGSDAASLHVNSGELIGASGVTVDGTSYDVVFADDTCVALFNGCDSNSDFPFATLASAQAASQALLDQVFIDGPAWPI